MTDHQDEADRQIRDTQPADPLAAWRHECESKSIAELQDGLDRNLFNREKGNIARTVIETKREKQREQGEVAMLTKELDSLKQELRDKRTELSWTRRGVIIGALAALAGWRQELAGFFWWGVVAVKGTTNALTVDAGPLRFDTFQPRPGTAWLFHQFTVRVRHPTPNVLANLRAEISAIEPSGPLGAALPLSLRIHRVGIHEAIVDVVRVNVNWLDTGPIQWCGKTLLVAPPDDMKPGIYNDAQTGHASRRRYIVKVTVATEQFSASRDFVFEPGKPTFTFVAL